MHSLVQIIILIVLLLAETTDAEKGLTRRKGNRLRCNVSCYSRFPTICASNGKTYRGLCELTRARCNSRTSIKFVKFGKCPTCKVKQPIRCFVPPCLFPSCPARPNATCVSFCPCKSEYYHRGRKVNCYARPKLTVNLCHLKFCGRDGICKVVQGKAVCVSKGAVCSLRKVVGPCKARFLRYYFNTVTQNCQFFYYGGCRGNRNNFRTKKQCESTCKPNQDICSLPPVQGPCEAHIRRYFYNVTSSKCEKFYYGGCEGNKNNFNTIKECEKKCKRSVLSDPCIATTCLVGTRCVVVNGAARCILSLPTVHPLCAAVTCLKGTICVISNGRAACAKPCSSNRECKQQGSFCNLASGVCQCSRFCLSIHLPVCGSDGKRYGNKCLLNAEACRANKTITVVPCNGKQ